MTRLLSPSRRDLLAALGVASAAALPTLTLPGPLRAAQHATGLNMLVLIELAGGNDGLNTVIPIRDDAYRALRPEIGIPRREALDIRADTGLHPAMRSLAGRWERGEMRIIEGVGYPNPNRSHFRSIEIWNSGAGPEARTRQGWLASSFAERAPAPDADADGLVIGGEMGPMAGGGRFAALRDLETFTEAAEAAEAAEVLEGAPHAVRPQQASDPLAHVMATYDSARITSARIRQKLEQSRARVWRFPDSGIGEQLRNVARLLDAGVEVPVFKVVQDGYDTHEGQPEAHSHLLADLSEAVDAFARAMAEIGLWDLVTVVTYSEFGRRARENGSYGTDHGTAAPVFALGGAVAGGLAGARPALDRLEDDDLVFTTDYRAVYAGILRDLWGLEGMTAPGSAPIRLLRA